MTKSKVGCKRALVTGATGFIGGCLCKSLIDGGGEVHALVRSTSNIRQLETLGESFYVHIIRSSEMQEIIDIVGAVMPGSIFHLAATKLYEHSPADIDSLLESNMLAMSMTRYHSTQPVRKHFRI